MSSSHVLRKIEDQKTLRKHVNDSTPFLQLCSCYIDTSNGIGFIDKVVEGDEIFYESYNPIENLSKKPRKI